MEMISLIGLILSIVLFSVLSWKGVSAIFTVPLSAVLVLAFSGQDILEIMKTVFMVRTAGIVSSYFLLFSLSALFGKLVSDSGIARTVAHALSGIAKKSEKNKKMLGIMSIVALNAILTYSGISLFVLTFTIVAIAKDLYEELDIPWGMYGFGLLGSATFTLSMLPGSPQVQNLIPTKALGTTAMAAPLLGILSAIFMITISMIYLRSELKRYARKNEGFLPSGARIKADQVISQDFEKVAMWKCIIALLTPLIVMNGLKQAPETALLCAGIVTYVLCFKHLKNIKQTINVGFTSALNPLIVLGLGTAFGAVMASTSGFQMVINGLYSMPIPEVAKMLITVIVPSAVMGSSTSGLTVAYDLFTERYIATGLHPEVIHRLTTMASNLSLTPQCGGVLNTFAITKLNHKEAYKNYFVVGMIMGLTTLIFATLISYLGIR